MSKINSKAKRKFSGLGAPTGDGKPGVAEAVAPGIISSSRKRQPVISRTHRFTESDIQDLNDLTTLTYQESDRVVSEAQIIRALIKLGKKTPLPKLIKEIKSIW